MEHFADSTDQTVPVGCPACGSSHCQLQATARKAGTVVRGVLGAIISAGMSGATVGAAQGAALVSIVTRRLPATTTGAIGGAIVGFAWGAIAGHNVGAEIDKSILMIYECRACGFEF